MGGRGGSEILVVDDDPDIRETIREVLREEGYAVATAKDGRDALRYLEAASARNAALPGLILLDLMMPNMTGEQFQEAKRAHPELVAIPVVILSASGSAAEAQALGAREVLGKPVPLVDLLHVVARLV